MYWAYDAVDNRVVASTSSRTHFRFRAANLSDGDILINSDMVSLQMKTRTSTGSPLFVNVDLESGALIAGRRPGTFRFGALQGGCFVINEDCVICEEVEGGDEWELIR